MGFWSNLWQRNEQKQSVYERWLDLLEDRVRSRSGPTVTWQSALKVTTMLACCRVIAEGCAQVPLQLLRASPDGRKKSQATDLPLYDVLGKKPNYWQTSFEFREQLLFHLVMTGNSYCFKSRYRDSIGELLPIEPIYIKAERDDAGGIKVYKVRSKGGATQDFAPSQIWHVRGPSWDGWCGLDIAQEAREALGLALATEETHAAWHANGAKPSGVLSVEGKLDDKQESQLRGWIAKAIGSQNSGVPLIVDRAAKWYAQAMSGVDMQHLETRLFQAQEICRAARVMPIMIGISDQATTYASAEQMFLAHVVHTMSPWWERIENSIDVNLLSDKERRDGVFSKFSEKGMLRGSLVDTKDVVLGYVNGGVWTPNEGRFELDMDADDDPKSDELRVPANVVGINDEKPDPETTPEAKRRNEMHDALVQVMTREPPVTNIKVDAPAITVNTPEMKAPDVAVNISEGAVQLNATIEGTAVKAGDTKVEMPAQTFSLGSDKRVVKKVVTRKSNGDIDRVIETLSDGTRMELVALYDEMGDLVGIEPVAD